MEISVFTEGNISLPFNDVKKEALKRFLAEICKRLCLDRFSIALVVSDNEYIQNINNEYRKKNRPTDVIAFVYKDPPFPDVGLPNDHIGDIYISLEMALRQAKECNVSFEDEIKRLLVHGVLHIIGYDHEQSNRDARKMREKEEEILGFL